MWLGNNLRPTSTSEKILAKKIIRTNNYLITAKCAGAVGGKIEQYIGTSFFQIELNDITLKNFNKRIGRGHINNNKNKSGSVSNSQSIQGSSSTPHTTKPFGTYGL